MRYEIGENNAVSIYIEEQEAPFLFQPHYPNGVAWENAEAADAWAVAFIAHRQDPESNPFPSEPTK